MSDEECDEHLQQLPGLIDDEQGSDSSADDDQLEIVSDTEEGEDLLVFLNNYLVLESSDDAEVSADEDERQQEPPVILVDDEQGNDFNNIIVSTTISSSTVPPIIPVGDVVQPPQPPPKASGEPGSGKRKRKQWCVKEKLFAIITLEKNLGNKQLTALQCGCTRYQLSQWFKRKIELEALSKVKYGKKRKRLNGGGSKVKYVELDDRLLLWFRQKRTFFDPQAPVTTGTTTTTTIRREKVTFRRLQRQGKLLSDELKHDCPSIKWFARFMRRHRLSLQKPKRNQKLPLTEVYPLVNGFYDYIRRASKWTLSRGLRGAFLPRDVCNMDESPLTLYGDQSKLSINDVNTSNEIEGCLSNKRFATVILTVFGEDNTRVGPVLPFKGKGQVLALEKSQYAKGVKVFFTPKVVNNRITMDKYMEYWKSKVNDKHPKLFISDSSNTHLDQESSRLLRKQNIVVAVIPKGCTMYIQALDVFVFSVFKHHYYECAEEYIEKAGGRSKIKLTASQSRVLCTRLTAAAWKRTVASIDFSKNFREIGYTWIDDVTPIKPHTLPGYIYDQTDRNLTHPTTDSEITVEETNDENATNFNITNKMANKQLKLSECWKK